ncbi:MAG: cytochrome c biogenesis protein CcsA, partial [Candidatus Symbiothrix sp.]|nr:cytochrome c biogenesis protein CcsA [Candidatus Symbiothrix sp.]
WDAKETWALITLFIYALPLHKGSFPFFRNPQKFHIYCIIAFFSILMTFFGVSYFLGGMHSYVG